MLFTFCNKAKELSLAMPCFNRMVEDGRIKVVRVKKEGASDAWQRRQKDGLMSVVVGGKFAAGFFMKFLGFQFCASSINLTRFH